MKILHALVGYLAVTSLPFHPFAFASLLEIDYDGYVENHNASGIDNALMKQVLDSIIETCQGVTMQNHSHTTLLKRGPGDTSIIDARQDPEIAFPEGIPSVAVLFIIIGAIVLGLIWLVDDNDVRGNDVEFLVEHFD